MTSRLNQDIIENLFSSCRQRGGYNKNPTVRTFRTTFGFNSKINLIKPSSSSNCELDDDEQINYVNIKPIEEDNREEVDEENDIDAFENQKYSSLDTSIENNVAEKPNNKSISLNITLQDCSEIILLDI